MNFAQNLRFLREQKKMTQREVADELEVSPGAVAMWEQGNRTPYVDDLVKIANYFSVTLDELITKELVPLLPVYARNLKYLREKSNLKRSDIADLLQVKQLTIELYETNKRAMAVEDIEKIADFFGVTMDQMIKQDLSTGKYVTADDNGDLLRRSDVMNVLRETFEEYSMKWSEDILLDGFSSAVPKAIRDMPAVDLKQYIALRELEARR